MVLVHRGVCKEWGIGLEPPNLGGQTRDRDYRWDAAWPREAASPRLRQLERFLVCLRRSLWLFSMVVMEDKDGCSSFAALVKASKASGL
ncbi:hypothetical protein TanjilG_12251 [Lupinus angustifolius]|uniref:Uncharacterized protein n=1 Tax=Lupinus angustifolius TaxID=3871 RepID=A0A1J7GK48_LUPAN|nr:hypothetical protein TanjilG_12251 [Lupinus angustifolius]